jgi:hypothetical protein
MSFCSGEKYKIYKSLLGQRQEAMIHSFNRQEEQEFNTF